MAKARTPFSVTEDGTHRYDSKYPHKIKYLVQNGQLFESRYFGELFGHEDLYRFVEDVADNGFLWFTVRRGSYERINWLSIEKACVFIAHSVIDSIIKEDYFHEMCQ